MNMMIFLLSPSNGVGLLIYFSLMGEPLSLGNSGWGRSVSGFCGRVGGCGSWGVGGHSTGGWSKVGLLSGDWLTVGPSMGSWSSILSFGSSCHHVDSCFNRVLPQLSVHLSVLLFSNSASDDTESKRSVS